MKISEKEIESILKLDGPSRYKHFVKRVADWEEAWGLYSDGWSLAETDSGDKVFPLWPAEAYAKLCAKEEWEGYEPSEIPLDDLFDELLPRLASDGVFVGVFYTPSDKGVTVEANQLVEDLRAESSQY